MMQDSEMADAIDGAEADGIVPSSLGQELDEK